MRPSEGLEVSHIPGLVVLAAWGVSGHREQSRVLVAVEEAVKGRGKVERAVVILPREDPAVEDGGIRRRKPGLVASASRCQLPFP
ncbi:unnamed protein product [Phytomonas sp. Hart1]|nr:unnamed protein product [Phytomonas sp. Hart1]|eukprot:CCW69940.1 unnamed protein product [Phytomonas sp. isolate Hart1]